jgi:hypothetical protein
MKNDLWKKHLKAEDNRGCEFGYTVYSTRYPDGVRREYVSDHFGITAASLRELKNKMSEQD